VVSADPRGEAFGPGLGGGGGGKQRRGVRDSGPERGTLDASAARTPAPRPLPKVTLWSCPNPPCSCSKHNDTKNAVKHEQEVPNKIKLISFRALLTGYIGGRS
jgi:hypothetical protein